MADHAAADHHAQQAMACHARGQLAQAIAHYRQLLALRPGFAQAHYNLGIAQHALGLLEEAADSYRQAIALKPDYAAAHNNLGVALKAMGQLADAIAEYRQALAVRPDLADAHSNLGNALATLGLFEDAVSHCQTAVGLQADHAEAHNNLANALRELRRTDAAERHYLAALALRPRYPEAWANLGHLRQDQGRVAEAIACYQDALALRPDYPEALGNAFYLLRQRCDWRGHARHADAIVRGVAAGQPGYAPFPLLSVTDSCQLQQRCAQTHARQLGLVGQVGQAPLWAGRRHRHRRIRVAYLSPDFRDHPLSYLLAGVLERHDKSRFEVFGVGLVEDGHSATNRRLRRAFCHYQDASLLSARAIAQQVCDWEIDIAVDLAGYTKHAKPAIFAHRPAPVQVNYLGFPGTMGLPGMDYLIADRYVIPEDCQRYYSEQPVYMPDCFQANDHLRPVPGPPRPRADYGLPATGVVWCAFNNSYKITPPLFAVWMRLLAKVPASVLWLLAVEPQVAVHLRQMAAGQGVDPGRLVFAGHLPYAEHLARLQVADVFLDTLPFNGGTTASDALWAGVPVVTVSGQAFAARMAGSLLTAIGLPELIAPGIEAYERLACGLASHAGALAELRRKLAARRHSAPLFDSGRFCGHLESAYAVMHGRAQRGEPPAPLEVGG